MALVDFSLGDVGNLFRGIREAITGDKIKDPIEMAKIELELTRLENALNNGQIEINKIEAQHPSLFVAGWRPSAGWVATISLGLMFIPKAIVITSVWTYQCILVLQTHGAMAQLPLFPDLGAMDMIGLLGTLLGVGGMRMWEKYKGVDTKLVGVK